MNNNSSVENRLHRVWWIPLITGLLAIGFGIWCFCSPETSLPVFAYTFSICIVVAGFMNIFYSLMNVRARTNWGWSLALGILEVLCGGWMFTWSPETLAVAFCFGVGVWVLFAAINGIAEAAYFSRYSTAWTVWMILLLVGTIIFGFYFLSNPLFGGVAGWLWIGFSLILFGLWRISLAFKIRSISRKL